MLKSLHIVNYRNLKDFKIQKLEHINLITGKNNTGKSSILDAICLYASRGDVKVIQDILEERGEDYTLSSTPGDDDILDKNIKTLSALFTDRKNDKVISIGEIDNDTKVTFKFVKYQEENITEVSGGTIRRKTIIDSDKPEEENMTYKPGFQIIYRKDALLLELDANRYTRANNYKYKEKADKWQFLSPANYDRGEQCGILFDNIALTDKESYVIEALRLIEPTTERIAFVKEDLKARKAVIKLSDNPEILPLLSMGDGINRILSIILSLVNADNGFLLIDEFENGFHHSIQEKLWEIIFKLAKKLNIQVFVTTHSEDCISGFQKVLNRPESSVSGKLIRLENKNGAVREVEFSAEELKNADELDIEIR
ncbi:MAG: AAA family ATPase [Tannerellaceae bacterium]|nr:AAA family ATPase [Tannerellaceae bacterium]